MNVLLIRPPYTRLRGVGQPPYYPLGLGYISSVLNMNGFPTKLYHAENPGASDEAFVMDAGLTFDTRSICERRYQDAIRNDQHPVWVETRQVLKEYNPDLVGISVLSVEVAAALKISKLCKEHNPECKVVWGGLHPSFMPEETLKNDEVDFVIRGEGEYPMVELCRALKQNSDLEAVQSLVFIKDGKVIQNEQAPPIADLNDLPYPDRENIFFPEAFSFESLGSMIISRGCPFRCSFCSSRNFWPKKVRMRSPEHILEEIRYLKDRYGTKHIMFWDDSFTINRNVIRKYCNLLIESGVRVTWKTATRADLIDEDLLDLMKRAGCVKLEVGVESGSERMRKIIFKDVTDDQIISAFNLIHKKGIAVGAFFMAGFPEEQVKDMDMTLDMMKKLKATEIAFNIFDPMPGSTEYEKCISMGLVPESPDWNNFPLWPDAHYAKEISPEVFSRKANKIASWVYSYNNSFSTKYRRNKWLVIHLFRNDPVYLSKRIISFVLKRLRLRSAKTGFRERTLK